ncbi:MAG: aminoacyl-tRNA hydrolase [Actinomycetales bacterium]|nr:MAG: aminoacyl-tRNA hydrolase [Actinomycetales bacterium]
MSQWLVVGLGNPGPRYAANRHNVGAMVVGELARRHSVTGGAGRGRSDSDVAMTTTSLERFSAHRARAHVCSVRLGVLPGGVPGPAAVLAVPAAYMNESGGPVKALLGFYGIDPDRLIVAHDDLDLAGGTIRLKRGGGEGGHNGLRSISRALDTRDYLRVRVGIDRPPGRMDPADYVLRDFSSAERVELPLTVAEAADAAELLVHRGLTDAQQVVHAPRAT